MKRYLIAFYFILLGGSIKAQPEVYSALPEFELSLISFEFYNNDSNYRKNKVSQVSQYFEYGSKKRELMYHALYDANGALRKRITYDTVIRTNEIIEIDRSDADVYIVTRKINKKSILALGPVKYEPDYWMRFPREWNGYRQIDKYWTDIADSLIRFKAIYTFSKDSNVLVKGYLYDNLIDSGQFLCNASTVFRNNYIEKYHTTRDTIYLNDTTVYRKKQDWGDGYTTVISKYIYDRLVHKVKYENFKSDTLKLVYADIYEYTNKGELQSAVVWDPGNFWAAKTVIKYNVDDIYSKEVGRIEAKYGPDDKITEWYKYDWLGRLIENFFPYNPYSEEVIRYTYFPNGLLKEKICFNKEEVRHKTCYEYKYR